MLGHFAQIGGNDFSEFAYDCTCGDPAVYAYVYPDQFGTVYLCGAFWGAPTIGADSQAGTLVHEVTSNLAAASAFVGLMIYAFQASHFTVNGGTKDYAYGREDSQSLAQSNPDEAVFNADSHEYFAENVPSQA